MAVAARIVVQSADRTAHDRLQAAVESRISDAGRPPEGLMVHIGYPDRSGFVYLDLWKTEELFQGFMNDLLRPALAEVGLVADEPEIAPAWSFARP